jgi:hypothetical protein
LPIWRTSRGKVFIEHDPETEGAIS